MTGTSTILGSNQSFPGTSGDDTVTAQSNDTVSGADGNDSLSFTGTNDTINGNIGNDSIESTSFAATSDTLFGGQGNDYIYAYSSSSLLSGDIGNDTLIVDGNFDTVSGGIGNDTIISGLDIYGDFEISDQSGKFRGELLLGGQGNDLIINYGSSSFLSGDIGNDTLEAEGSFETVNGGDGNDFLEAIGFDSLAFEGEGFDSLGRGDTINGNMGDDIIIAGGLSDSSIRGGQGNDSLEAFDMSDNKIYGDLGNDFVILGEEFFNDSIYGGGNLVNGGQGNDSMLALETLNDTVRGGQGDDVIELVVVGGDDSIGSYNSIVFGDIGNDNLIADDVGFGNDSLGDQTAVDTLVGGDGSDRLFSTGNSNVIMTGDGTGSTDPGPDLFYVQGFGETATVAGAEHESTVTDFVSGNDHLSFDSISGTNANFTATAAEVSDVADAGAAAMAVETASTLYVFVAGATDGYLFYNGGGTTDGMFNAEITLTGKNDISDVTFNDIVSVTAVPGLSV